MKDSLLEQKKYRKIHNLFSSNKKLSGSNGEEITKTISYKLKFAESARFIVGSLSNLVNNVAEGSHKIECKYERNREM